MVARNGSTFRRIYLPYCLVKLKDGTWLPLNRNYKPIGVTSSAWADYESAPTEARLKLSVADLKRVSIHESPTGEMVYLYNDGTVPRPGTPAWTAYAPKLERLLAR